jgi:hypothetical protein
MLELTNGTGHFNSAQAFHRASSSARSPTIEDGMARAGIAKCLKSDGKIFVFEYGPLDSLHGSVQRFQTFINTASSAD